MMRLKLIQELALQRKMNQSLLNSIHLLKLSGIELLEYIEELAEENPLIEEVNLDKEITYYRSTLSNEFSIGEINPVKLTMYEQLKQQLYMLDIADDLRPIIEFGIDSLDKDGYLEIELELWATKCHTTFEKVEQALTQIQSLEPIGIGARTLSECILLQLKETIVYQPFISDLLTTHLDWIAEDNIAAMIKEYEITDKMATELILHIKRCHPKPGELLASKQAEFIIPEANISSVNGVWQISFYKWNAPTIEINEAYAKLGQVDQKTTDYLKEKHRQIDWLREAISFRANTLERVIKKIIEKQRMFFEHGPFMLKPLTLKEIAEELGLHISTVSRTISNKYVQTKNGVIPLSFFLQTGIGEQNGKQTSSYVIKQLISELVKYEDKQKPLSDNALKERLDAEFSIKIARRTVMKYRDQLKIPASNKRKRLGVN